MSNKISIIMATYNRAHYILETLDSIKNQTYSNFECIIIDDGGTDNTHQVIAPILTTDPRFSFFKRTDNYTKGLPGSRNYGLDLAQGDYIIFFDDDDIVHPQLLEISLQTIKSYDFVHFQKKSFIDQKPSFVDQSITNSKVISTQNIFEIITNQIAIASCTVLWSKKVFKTNRFIETLMYAEEWELYTRIFSQNIQGLVIDNFLYFNRKHENSNTSEFYRDNPVRRDSYAKAILYVAKNLKHYKLLNNTISDHLINKSLRFSEFNLTNDLIKVYSNSNLDKIFWNFKLSYLKLKFRIYNNLKKCK